MAEKTDVANALVTILSSMPELNYVAFDKVRLSSEEFRDSEFPAVQLYGVREASRHENRRRVVDWRINLEIVLRSTSSGGVKTQRDLWDLQYLIERKLWEDPQIGLTSNMIHLLHGGGFTTLQLTDPLLIHTIELTASFYQALVDVC